MSTFTLAISYLTTSSLPWFMDLRFQVLMQYCSLQHWTLLLSPVTSTTGYCFCFGSIPTFFLELFLHWSPVAYWAPTDLGSSSFSILSFCLFILFMGSQGKNTEVACHSLLQWTTFCQTSPPWPAHLGWLHTAWLSFIELDKAVVLVYCDWLVFCDYGFSVSALLQHLLSYLLSFNKKSKFITTVIWMVSKQWVMEFLQTKARALNCLFLLPPLPIVFQVWCHIQSGKLIY